MVFGLVVPSEPESPRRVREAVRRELRAALDAQLAADLELLLSEVVANAVRYGGAGRGDDTIDVRVDISDNTVSAYVYDSGAGFPRAHRPEPRSGRTPGGFGLFLLDQLSSRWGVERHENGFSVWFRLASEHSPTENR